ncbi:MAG TPA: HEAT repeat domain-containing protein, partial [Gemmata sp.]|nr:HEAT repeat domain-containing protein [Gemmata sp.]
GRVVSVKGNLISIVGHKLEGPPTEPVARALRDFKSKSPSRRASAVGALAHAQPDDRRAEVIQLLEPLLNDSDPFLRDPATEAFCVWAAKDEVPTLLKLLPGDQLGGQAKHAIKALVRLKDERAIGPIAGCVENFFTRNEARDALIAFGPVAEDQVLKLFNHKDHNVRSVACDIVKKIGGPRSFAPVAICLGERDTRQAASAALVAFGPAAENETIKLLKHKDNNARAEASEILGKIGTEKCLPALEEAARDPDLWASSHAKKAITTIKMRL